MYNNYYYFLSGSVRLRTRLSLRQPGIKQQNFKIYEKKHLAFGTLSIFFYFFFVFLVLLGFFFTQFGEVSV